MSAADSPFGIGKCKRKQVVCEGIAAERRLQIFGQPFFRCRFDDNGQGSLPERRPSAHAERQYAQISRGDGCVRLHTEHRPQERTAHTSRRKPPRSSLFYSIRERMCRINRLAEPLVKAVCRAGPQSALIECRPQQREQCVLRQSDRRFTSICGLLPHGASRRRQERCAEREIAVSQMRSQQTR